MLSYLLTVLTAIPWVIALAITPKYWGSLDAKHLTGSVSIFYVGWFLIAGINFRQLQQNLSNSNNYINIIFFYINTVIKYAVFLLILCLIYGFISVSIHKLLSNFMVSAILDRLSLFIFGLGTVILLLRFRWIQPSS
jgi:hypothetical protein